MFFIYGYGFNCFTLSLFSFPLFSVTSCEKEFRFELTIFPINTLVIDWRTTEKLANLFWASFLFPSNFWFSHHFPIFILICKSYLLNCACNIIYNGLVVILQDSQFRGLWFKTTGGSMVESAFHPSESIQWVPGTPGNSVVKRKLSPCSGFVTLRQLHPNHKLEPKVYFCYIFGSYILILLIHFNAVIMLIKEVRWWPIAIGSRKERKRTFYGNPIFGKYILQNLHGQSWQTNCLASLLIIPKYTVNNF